MLPAVLAGDVFEFTVDDPGNELDGVLPAAVEEKSELLDDVLGRPDEEANPVAVEDPPGAVGDGLTGTDEEPLADAGDMLAGGEEEDGV